MPSPPLPAPPALAALLFTPLQLGELALAHRIVLPALELDLAEDGLPGAALADHHLARCSAGGLQLSAGLAVSPVLRQGPRRGGGLYCAAQVNAWRELSRAVQQRGGLLLAQLGQPLPAGAALDARQLDQALDDYRSAAENAGDAGFDGIELLAAHDALPARLLRQGGPAALGELIELLAGIWAPGRLGLCLDAAAPHEGLPLQGLAYLHLAAPWDGRTGISGRVEPPVMPPPCPLLLSGGLRPADGAALVGAGHADAVGFGRAFLAAPALVQELHAQSS